MDSPSKEEETLDQQENEESSTSENQDIEKESEDSSTSETSEAELSTLDLVKEAIKSESKDTDETNGSSEKDNEEDSKSEDELESEDNPDEPTEDELNNWKPKTRKRFEQLQSKYRDVNERLEKSEVDAGLYRQYSEFLDTNRITKDEANNLFNIGALMKSDPQQALQALTPYYNQLLEVTGNVLPNDLKQQVEQGYITEKNAVELSMHRAQSSHQQVMNQQNDQQQQQQVVAHQQELSTNIQSALADLENNWQKSDPDYDVKSTRIQERVKLMWFESNQKGQMPRSVDEAIGMAERAKREIEKEFRQFRPKKPVTSVDGGGASQVRPQPKNTLDVIRQTVGG